MSHYLTEQHPECDKNSQLEYDAHIPNHWSSVFDSYKGVAFTVVGICRNGLLSHVQMKEGWQLVPDDQDLILQEGTKGRARIVPITAFGENNYRIQEM